MSDIIHLLPDSVANQIAAGEVIQRPASIIKELVENSLDAGATHIHVVVEDAGKSLVQVIDNGCGMSTTDARLAFERHATSKIRQATDLFSLTTMGFRGEALPSIAAVAQVELRTRMADSELGTCITIDGSKVTGQSPVQCPVGANFAVRNLFFNIPARRKFLKSNQTELTNILTEFERIALAHPATAFTLHSGQTVMMDLPTGNFRQRIVGIFGAKTDKSLVPIEVETTLAHIHGFVGMPHAARKKNAHQFLFVNGRFMRHPYFAKAILSAYDKLIPEGQQVPFFINFEVDPSRIDVNIHPTKTEIKFEDDNAIFQILMASVRESLGKYGAVPAIDFNANDRMELPLFNEQPQQEFAAPPKVHLNPSFNPFEPSSFSQPSAESTESPSSPDGSNEVLASSLDLGSTSSNTPAQHHNGSAPTGQLGTNRVTSSIDWESVYDSTLNHTLNQDSEILTSSLNGNPSESPATASAGEQTELLTSSIGPATEQPAEEASSSPALFKEHADDKAGDAWKCPSDELLQYRGRYIVCPMDNGLALVDQHRAHIRILYEKYMRQMEQHQSASQRLLFPEMLEVSPSESVVMESLIPQLQQTGFDISPLGNGSFSIMATPTGTEGLDPTGLLRSILDDAVSGQAKAQASVTHIIAHGLARKVAIPIGQVLSIKEMGQLLNQLFSTSTPNFTPNGAPTLVILPKEQIEGWF